MAVAQPAHAQFAGSVALSSNETFRGETISRDDPTLSLSASLDHQSGLFAGAGASIAAGGGDVRLAQASQYAGYALRSGTVSFEAGVVHRTYAEVTDTDYRKDFVEFFAGITHKSVKARVYVSPNYRRDNRASYYGEMNTRLIGVGRWSLDGHAGLSLIPGDRTEGAARWETYYDWRLQVSRPLGRLFVSGGVAATNYPVYGASGKARAFVSTSIAF